MSLENVLPLTDLPYRPCVGIMLLNKDGLIWTGERTDTAGAWQMPQGGMDAGETIEVAGLRELEEEISVTADQITILARTKDWVTYDLPGHLLGTAWRGKYRGQKQHWFLCRLEAGDSAIDINTEHPEFSRWRWSTADELVDDIVPFKKAVYQKLLNEFASFLA